MRVHRCPCPRSDEGPEIARDFVLQMAWSAADPAGGTARPVSTTWIEVDMTRSSAKTPVEHGDATLMKGSVGWLGSLGMAVGVMAPTGGLAFFFGVTAIFV